MGFPKIQLVYRKTHNTHNEDAHNLHQNASSDKPIVVSAQSQTDNTLRTSLIPLRGFLETHKTNTETKKIPAVIKKFPLIWTTGRISSVDHYLVRSERVLVVRCGQTIWRNGCVPRALSHYTHVDQQSVHTHVIISPTPLPARDVITLLFTPRGEHLWRKLIVRAVSQFW